MYVFAGEGERTHGGGYMSWYTKEEIEKKLCEYLGAEKVIWLKNGIWQDETNEHIDNVCAFVKAGRSCFSLDR